MDKIEALAALLQKKNRIVFFGGAGVSTESGIPDFRSADGLYHQSYAYPPEEILSHSFFINQTEEFYRFYRNKMLCPEAKPNPAHLALARLEALGKLTAVVTQNIDGLHQAGGSKTVYELHGSVLRNYCQACGKSFEMQAILHSEGIPRCGCGGVIKPDVVLYEESLDSETLNGAVCVIAQADLLIVGGTSLNVCPAAGLLKHYCGDALVLINKSATPADGRAGLIIREPIGEVLSRAVALLQKA